MKDYSTARGARTGYEGDYTLKEGVKHMRYAVNAKGASEIRMVPAMVNGHPQPMFIGKEATVESLSDAFAMVDTVNFFGPGGVSMICPPRVQGEDKGPVHHFVEYIRKFVDDNPRSCPPEWRRWQGKKEDGDTIKPKEVLSRPSPTMMVQGYLIRHKGDRILSKEGAVTTRYPVVLCIRASGANDLRDKLLSAKVEDAPWGPYNNNIGGDLVDPAKGLTLIVEPHDVVYNTRPQTWYQCRAGEPMALSLDDISEVWAPWEDILDLNPSFADLGLRMAKAFNATTVITVFERCPVYRQLISDTLRDMAADEAGVKHSTGVPQPLGPRTTIRGNGPSVPARAIPPSEQPSAWTPSEPAVGGLPSGGEEDGANEEPEAPAPSPVNAIRQRVSDLQNRLNSVRGK